MAFPCEDIHFSIPAHTSMHIRRRNEVPRTERNWLSDATGDGLVTTESRPEAASRFAAFEGENSYLARSLYYCDDSLTYKFCFPSLSCTSAALRHICAWPHALLALLPNTAEPCFQLFASSA